MRIALVDADSLIWIVGYHHKDYGAEATTMVELSCDSIIRALLAATNAERYMGVFSSKEKTFRHELYKYAEYKGNRPPKPEWFVFWEPMIVEYMTNQWKFVTASWMEADDVVAAVSLTAAKEGWTPIICTPDKDLKQIPGLHFDYKHMDNQVFDIDENSADLEFWLSMLTGDSSDNVKALPGLGPVKAKAVLKDLLKASSIERSHVVKQKYLEAFGDYYGSIIFDETLIALMMVQPEHPCWEAARQEMETWEIWMHDVPSLTGDLDQTLLKELGWV